MHDNPMRRRRVLVTGASGRVGRHVVDALAGDCEVTVLDLTPPVQDVAFIEGNVLDLDGVRTAMAGQDAVIHLAGVDIDVPAKPETYFGTNVTGTWNAVQAAREAGVRKVVLASSIAATGIGEMRPDFPPEYLPVDEGACNEAGPRLRCRQAGGRGHRERLRARGRPVDHLPAPGGGHRRIEPPPHRPSARRIPATPGSRPTSPARTRAAPSPPRSTHDAPFDAMFIAADDSASTVPTLERLAGVYGAAPPVRNPEWFDRGPLRLSHRRDPRDAAPPVAADLDVGGGGGATRNRATSRPERVTSDVLSEHHLPQLPGEVGLRFAVADKPHGDSYPDYGHD